MFAQRSSAEHHPEPGSVGSLPQVTEPRRRRGLGRKPPGAQRSEVNMVPEATQDTVLNITLCPTPGAPEWTFKRSFVFLLTEDADGNSDGTHGTHEDIRTYQRTLVSTKSDRP